MMLRKYDKMGYTYAYKGVILSLFFNLVNGIEWCDFGEYCHYGCCEDSCCPNLAAILPGAIVGGLILLTMITVCIVCICCACQCCKKESQHPGGTIQPANTTTVFSTGSQFNHPPPTYNQFAYPSPSDRHPPPSYSQVYSTLPNASPSAPPVNSNPVYPPGQF